VGLLEHRPDLDAADFRHRAQRRQFFRVVDVTQCAPEFKFDRGALGSSADGGFAPVAVIGRPYRQWVRVAFFPRQRSSE
jgi:hypothetical protein